MLRVGEVRRIQKLRGGDAGVIYPENEISSYDDVVWIFARANFNLTGRFMKFEEGKLGRVERV